MAITLHGGDIPAAIVRVRPFSLTSSIEALEAWEPLSTNRGFDI